MISMYLWVGFILGLVVFLYPYEGVSMTWRERGALALYVGLFWFFILVFLLLLVIFRDYGS